MSIPKFNLSKLKESVSRQQKSKKKDIKNLLLMDRLRSQIASQKAADFSKTFGKIGKKLTKKDKVDLKENPDGVLYNEFIDSILMGTDFEIESALYVGLQNYDRELFEGTTLMDSFYFFEMKLMENSAMPLHFNDGNYLETVIYIDHANNRLVYCEINQGNNQIKINSRNFDTSGFFSLKNTKEATLKNTMDAFCEFFDYDNIHKGFFDNDIIICTAYFGYNNKQTLFLLLPDYVDSGEGLYGLCDVLAEYKSTSLPISQCVTKFNETFMPRVVSANEIIEMKSMSEALKEVSA